MNTYRLAETLAGELAVDDPLRAGWPMDCYDTLYRSQSHFGVHASANVLAGYIIPLGGADAIVIPPTT